MITNIITKALSGGVVGYFTNDLAVKMLFRKRFGLGGIVLKTHDQFVDNISHLVEKDIVNHHSLLPELQSPQFEDAINEAIALFTEELPIQIPKDLKLSDIPKSDESLDQLRAILFKALDPITQTLIDYLIDHLTFEGSDDQSLDLKTWLHDQLPQLCQSLSEHLLDPITKDLPLQSLYHQLGEMTLEDLTDCEALSSEIKSLIGRSDITTFLMRQDLPEVLLELIQQWSKKTLSEVVPSELILAPQLHALLDVLKGDVIAFVESSKGQQLLRELLGVLFDTLKKSEASIFELLPIELEQSATQFLKERLPAVLKRLIEFLKDQKLEIDQLIDATFQGNTSNILQDWLIDIFVGSISRRAKVITRATQFLQQYDADALAQKATDYLYEFLKNQSIRQIMSIIKTDLPSYALPKLVPILKDFVQKFELKSLSKWIDHPIPNTAWMDELLKTHLLPRIKDFFSQKDKIDKSIATLVDHVLVGFRQKKIKELLTQSTLDNLTKRLHAFVHSPSIKGGEAITQWFQDMLIKSDLKDLSRSEVVQRGIQKGIERQLVTLQHSLSQRPVRSFLTSTQLPDTHRQLSSHLIGSLPSQLEGLLTGRIEQLVRSNLSQHPPEMIRDMVEKFMGKEIAPINVLGAVLGTLTGTALSALPTMDNIYLNTGIAGLAYGATGYGTNALALKMIFRPYEGKYLGGVRVPFTPGVVTKNQKRFAGSMGNFVNESLLNKDAIRQKFDQNKDDLMALLQGQISQNDFALVDQLLVHTLDQQGDRITTQVLDMLDPWMSVEHLTTRWDELGGKPFGKLITSKLVDFLQDSTTLSQQLSAWLSHPQQVRRALELLLEEGRATKALAWLEHQAQNMDISTLTSQLVQSSESRFKSFVSADLSDQLGEEATDNILQYFHEAIRSLLHSDDFASKILRWVDGVINGEVKKAQHFDQLLGGKLIDMIEGFLHGKIVKLVDAAILWLEDNEEMMAEEVYQLALKENKAALLYKKAIQRTVRQLCLIGLPDFLRTKTPIFEGILDEELEALATAKIGDIDLSVDVQPLTQRIQSLLESPALLEGTQKTITHLLSHVIFQRPLAELLGPLGWGSLEQIESSSFPYLWSKMRGNLELQSLLPICQELLSHIHLKVANDYALDDDTREALRQLLGHVMAQEAYHTWAGSLSQSLGHLEGITISSLVDWGPFRGQSIRAVSTLWQQASTQDFLTLQIQKLLGDVAPHLNTALDHETKHFVLEKLSAAIQASLSKHIGDLLEAVDIRGLVVREIEGMYPKEIEQLFEGFAGSYFRQLINYGFGFGLTFGLAIDVAFAYLIQLL